MPIELLLKTLFKFMGVTEDQMREVFTKGQSMVIDGSNRIAIMDARLARIEAKLGISEPLPETPKELTHDDRG